MTKTFALLVDSYRELNSKRLFWIALALSALVVLVFAAVGLDRQAITIFGWRTHFRFEYLAFISRKLFFKFLFTALGINFWLSWLATILAIVSTAGIFPDLLAGGSIDLFLSKPLSRLWLFGTKYVGGLLFVTVQVTVFCVAGFFVLGFKGGGWEPALFWAVPLVVLLFSYLFAICVLFGVLTRSTIASMLLTLVVWAAFWAVQQTEESLLRKTIGDQRHANLVQRRIESTKKEIHELQGRAELAGGAGAAAEPTTQTVETATDTLPSPKRSNSWWGWLPAQSPTAISSARSRLVDLEAEQRDSSAHSFDVAHTVAYYLACVVPKTKGTTELFTRQLIKRADLPTLPDEPAAGSSVSTAGPDRREHFRDEMYLSQQLELKLRERSAGWILGSSLAFEALVVGAAAWIFCRRDY